MPFTAHLTARARRLDTCRRINAFEAVNTILEDADDASSSRRSANDDDTLEERLQSHTPQSMGVVVSGSTGSGKTLAYCVPTLSILSQTLFTRERIRVKAEEDVGDVMGDMLARVMVQTSPSVRGQGYDQVGGKVSATGAALSSLGKSGTDVRSPVALIVVPTRELGAFAKTERVWFRRTDCTSNRRSCHLKKVCSWHCFCSNWWVGI